MKIMNDSSLKRIGILIVFVLVVFAAGSLYLFARPAPPAPIPPAPTPASNPAEAASTSSTQPKIAWSPTSTLVILSPSESATRDFAFVSDQDLQNVVIEAVPEIAGFLTIEPSTFASISAGQPQSVHMSLSIPSSTALATYVGTIHLRVGSSTLPQTLKVDLQVWRLFRSDQFGVMLSVPPTLQADEYQLSGLLGRGQGETLATFRSVPVGAPGTDAPVPGCFIYLSAEDNSDGLSLTDWLVQRSYRRPNDVDKNVSINGTPGILRTGLGDVFGNPFVVLFVSNGTFIFELGSNTFGDTACKEEFSGMLSTIRFGS
jgi:hypothetical protein